MPWKARALIILPFSSVLIAQRCLLPLFGAVLFPFPGCMWVVTGVSKVKADVNADITCGSLLKKIDLNRQSGKNWMKAANQNWAN